MTFNGEREKKTLQIYLRSSTLLFLMVLYEKIPQQIMVDRGLRTFFSSTRPELAPARSEFREV